MTNNESLFFRAQKTIPGGVNSPVRAFRSVGGTPRFFTHGAGAHAWDAGLLMSAAVPAALKKDLRAPYWEGRDRKVN